LYDRAPRNRLAVTLAKAFEEAKALAVEDLTQTSALPVSLPFLVDHAYETLDLMGEDFWPYGLESNRHTLETFARYMHEQRLTSQRLSMTRCSPKARTGRFRILVDSSQWSAIREGLPSAP
jgi:4,5-dihydroxyphthalate decarboxylase